MLGFKELSWQPPAVMAFASWIAGGFLSLAETKALGSMLGLKAGD